MYSTLVVIFCFNVEENIKDIIEEIKKLSLNKNRDFLFIEDCSIDNTHKILKSYKIKNAKIIRNKKNQGFGLNYKFSISYCLKKKYKKLIFLHGDNQYPASKITLIEKRLNTSSLCYGSRRLDYNNMKSQMPKLRFFANILLTFFINLLFNNNATEYFSGFRGLRVDKLKKINLNKFSDKWIIEQQIHFDFLNKKYPISEISIPTIYKKSQISKIPPFNYVFSVIINAIRFSILRN